MAEKTTQPTIEDLKAPLLAAVGAADLALATVNEIVAALRERAEEARTDATARVDEARGKASARVDEARARVDEARGKASARVDEARANLTKFQEEFPDQVTELRGKLTTDELRKAVEEYADSATVQYNKLVERGEAALERLRSQPALEEAADRVESVTDQAVELTQDALGSVASQTRAIGERAAKLVGVELPKKAEKAAAPVKKAAAKAPAKKAPAKKAPAKKAPAKKVTQK